jgi:hypothetical protein
LESCGGEWIPQEQDKYHCMKGYKSVLIVNPTCCAQVTLFQCKPPAGKFSQRVN